MQLTSLSLALTRAGFQSVAAFSPLTLFSAGEPGVWYDPSDMSTMFQDAAGTVPVTAVEQPVGRILDKSGRGNHATQVTATSRPVLSARVNLLTKTEQFNDAAWGKVNSSITSTSIKDPLGTNLAQEFTTNSIANPELQSPAFSAVASVVYTSSIYVKYVNSSYIRVITPVGSVWFAITSSSAIVGTNQVNSAQAIDAGDGWFRLVVTFTAASTASAQIKYTLSLSDGGSSEVIGSVYIWGASLVPANQASLPYQRVNTSTDYDTAGFPHYLRFDGVDDWLVTPTITPGIDKVQVFAGVRKLSDATRGVILESSGSIDTNNGALLLTAPDGASSTYAWDSKGTAIAEAIGTGFAAPITSVLTGLGDIAGDSAILRVNGTQAAQSTADQGTGNYLANQLRIGRRAGTSLPANINLYGLIVRFGSTLPAQAISYTETWLNGKTRAY